MITEMPTAQNAQSRGEQGESTSTRVQEEDFLANEINEIHLLTQKMTATGIAATTIVRGGLDKAVVKQLEKI